MESNERSMSIVGALSPSPGSWRRHLPLRGVLRCGKEAGEKETDLIFGQQHHKNQAWSQCSPTGNCLQDQTYFGFWFQHSAILQDLSLNAQRILTDKLIKHFETQGTITPSAASFGRTEPEKSGQWEMCPEGGEPFVQQRSWGRMRGEIQSWWLYNPTAYYSSRCINLGVRLQKRSLS